MGLFDKKTCDICGEKIGLLGNRKLEDGNLCKDCAAKLSPWFSGRRHSTLNDIKSQLESRQANKQLVATFRASRTYGEGQKKIYIDQSKGTFAVASDREMHGGNPDIIDASLVVSCNVEKQEHRTEMKYRNNQGQMVSYVPARYEYSYDFYCRIDVDNHPYIDDIKFQLNRDRVKVSGNAAHIPGGNNTFGANALGAIVNVVGQMADPGMNSQLNYYYNMGTQIQDTLNAARNNAGNPNVQNASAPMQRQAPNVGPWVCGCGGENNGNFCEFCGNPRPQ